MKFNVLEGGIAPQRGHATDAGADVFARGTFFINAGETVKIPLGVSLELDPNTMAVVYNRSSMAAEGLAIANSPVDMGYTGEIHAIMTNTTTDKLICIENGDKIAQVVIIPIIIPEVEVKTTEERGDGAFGSTNDN